MGQSGCCGWIGVRCWVCGPLRGAKARGKAKNIKMDSDRTAISFRAGQGGDGELGLAGPESLLGRMGTHGRDVLGAAGKGIQNPREGHN